MDLDNKIENKTVECSKNDKMLLECLISPLLYEARANRRLEVLQNDLEMQIKNQTPLVLTLKDKKGHEILASFVNIKSDPSLSDNQIMWVVRNSDGTTTNELESF